MTERESHHFLFILPNSKIYEGTWVKVFYLIFYKQLPHDSSDRWQTTSNIWCYKYHFLFYQTAKYMRERESMIFIWFPINNLPYDSRGRWQMTTPMKNSWISRVLEIMDSTYWTVQYSVHPLSITHLNGFSIQWNIGISNQCNP